MVGGWVDDGGYWIYNYDECLLDDEWKFAGYWIDDKYMMDEGCLLDIWMDWWFVSLTDWWVHELMEYLVDGLMSWWVDELTR